MKSKLLFAFALGALLAAAFFAFISEADAEPLHHEVQVVTGGRVVAQTYAVAVRDELARILPRFELFVDVLPHPGATTVKVTVIAPRLSSRNEGRIRQILEEAMRKPLVIVNGYTAIRQRSSFAYASRR
ncbi:hypothetical protein HYT45_02240 [Candidatus Uhrbacteria bacterium]|nr:hypothetical protein [Candidatus Uhrbacteria bacterium]